MLRKRRKNNGGADRMYALDNAEAWQMFRQQYWERSPSLFSMGKHRRSLPSECLRSVVAAADALSEGLDAEMRWLGSDGRVTRLESRDELTRNQLPLSSDVDFEHYWARRWTHGKDLFLNVGNLQSHSAGLWTIVSDFLAELYSIPGVREQQAWCDVYIGRYEATPFGVHLDSASNFMFCLAGRKTIYLWEPEFYHQYMERDPRPWQQWISHSVALELDNGQIAYWPSRFWHIATSQEYSVTMNIALYANRFAKKIVLPSFVQVVEEAAAALAERLAGGNSLAAVAPVAPVAAGAAGAAGDALPQEYSALRDALVGSWTAKKLASRLDYDLNRYWLRHISACGFPKGLHRKKSQPLTNDDALVARERTRIHCKEVEDPGTGTARLVLACNGHIADIDADPRIAELVNAISNDGPFTVAEIVARFSGEARDDAGGTSVLEPETVRDLLCLFWTWHALDTRDPRGRRGSA